MVEDEIMCGSVCGLIISGWILGYIIEYGVELTNQYNFSALKGWTIAGVVVACISILSFFFIFDEKDDFFVLVTLGSSTPQIAWYAGWGIYFSSRYEELAATDGVVVDTLIKLNFGFSLSFLLIGGVVAIITRMKDITFSEGYYLGLFYLLSFAGIIIAALVLRDVINLLFFLVVISWILEICSFGFIAFGLRKDYLDRKNKKRDEGWASAAAMITFFIFIFLYGVYAYNLTYLEEIDPLLLENLLVITAIFVILGWILFSLLYPPNPKAGKLNKIPTFVFGLVLMFYFFHTLWGLPEPWGSLLITGINLICLLIYLISYKKGDFTKEWEVVFLSSAFWFMGLEILFLILRFKPLFGTQGATFVGSLIISALTATIFFGISLVQNIKGSIKATYSSDKRNHMWQELAATGGLGGTFATYYGLLGSILPMGIIIGTVIILFIPIVLVGEEKKLSFPKRKKSSSGSGQGQRKLTAQEMQKLLEMVQSDDCSEELKREILKLLLTQGR